MSKKEHIGQYLFIIFGAIFLGIGAVCFLSPNDTITGGGIGISILLHQLFPSLTLGTLIALVSIPFIILGYIYFGKYYTFKTFIAMALTSFFADFFKEFLELKALTNDILLASIFGGVFIGLGVGFIIKGRASTGSTSVVGEILAMKTHFKTAEILLMIDACIMFSSIFVYEDVDKSLYSVLSVFVTSRVIDTLLTKREKK